MDSYLVFYRTFLWISFLGIYFIQLVRFNVATSKELGINVNTLHTWIGKYSQPKVASIRTTDHHFDEIKQLKKELARVTQERDLLKKAAAYFAKESL
jgi:transposase-like protein